MDYTLEGVYEFIMEEADKMGFEYFQLDFVRREFISSTYGFISARCKIIENTQEVTDEIRTLIIPKKIALIEDPNEALTWLATFPPNYFRLLRANALYKGGVVASRPNMIRNGEVDVSKDNPFRKPDKDHPLITQFSDYLKIDSGIQEVPEYAFIMYCKKPTFADINALNDRIVDLPDESILEIAKDVVTQLFATTGDQRTRTEFELQKGYSKNK